MGLISGLLKAGVAKKVLTEAQKPHNQAKARQLIAKLTSKGGRKRY